MSADPTNGAKAGAQGEVDQASARRDDGANDQELAQEDGSTKRRKEHTSPNDGSAPE